MVYMTFTHFEKVRISEVYAPKQGVYEGKQGFVYLLFRAVSKAQKVELYVDRRHNKPSNRMFKRNRTNKKL